MLLQCLRTLCTQFVRSRQWNKLVAVDGVLCTVATMAFYVLYLVGFKWGANGYLLAIISGDLVSRLGVRRPADLLVPPDMDLVEANEAFAAQSIAVARELGFDMSKVNVNGGAIALGHPVGASGARIIVTLLHEMAKRPEAKKGLATLCIGGGMGCATIVEMD